MKITYWKCKYRGDADEYDTEDGDWYWVYPCEHPDNKERYCHLDNKYGDAVAECAMAVEEIWSCKSSQILL